MGLFLKKKKNTPDKPIALFTKHSYRLAIAAFYKHS